ncbi:MULTISPECIES: helix-turn-helix domain-containing protein [Gammaproteobacteria]|uniref:helix-turn-helix domain-containing protein n=1 Tax=Gammaproteobacteria TaxID=1236 RepID=UPI001AE72F1B|nr:MULTISPECIES: helix-turn-helix domain-containing protein [Gammaproteobacteria]MBP0923856.1 helix-turn-helix domain-containing protein [Vibrio cholerae]MDY7587431.1 helix-turn-helix domain-containing protein [Vibrio cholerae]QYJ75716.1 helix-turn-helix domain-containing protein [Shewanella sp. FJAT-52076]
MNDDIFTIREVTQYLKLNEKTTYRLTAEGKLPGFKVGGSWRFRRAEVDKWIDDKINNKDIKE